MIDENIMQSGGLESTMRPQEMMQQTFRPQQTAEPVMMQSQQKAAVKTCPYCGAENEPEAMFCAQCGQPISKLTCPHCGAEVDADADFCEVCHHYIRKDEIGRAHV